MQEYFYITGSLFFCGSLGCIWAIALTLSKIEKHLALIASSQQPDGKAE